MLHPELSSLEKNPFQKTPEASQTTKAEYLRLRDATFAKSNLPKIDVEREKIILRLTGEEQNLVAHGWLQEDQRDALTRNLRNFHQLDSATFHELRQGEVRMDTMDIAYLNSFAEIDLADAESIIKKELVYAQEIKEEVNDDARSPQNIQERSQPRIGAFLNNIHKYKNGDVQASVMNIAEVAPWQVIKRLETACDQSTRDQLKTRIQQPDLEKLVDDPLEVRECLDTYLRYQRYEGLVQACELFQTYPPLDKTLFDELLKAEIQKGNAEQANTLCKLAAMNHIPVNESVKKHIQEKAQEERERREQRPKRELVEREINVTEEAVMFYTNQNILAELNSIADTIVRAEQLQGTNYPFKIKVQIEELAEQIRRDNEGVRRWMREYLIQAIDGERTHQGFLEETENDIELPIPPQVTDKQNDPTYHFKSIGTDEEIRTWLSQVKERFDHPKWEDTGFGGKPWVNITHAALELWKPATRPPTILKAAAERFSQPITKEEITADTSSIWVDHAFDLQHNNATVFDKNPGRIKLNPIALQEFLEKKKHASSTQELFEQVTDMLNDPHIPEDEQLSITAKNNITHKINQLRTIQTNIEKLKTSYGRRSAE